MIVCVTVALATLAVPSLVMSLYAVINAYDDGNAPWHLEPATMQCVSEFNWNQQMDDRFLTASPFFVATYDDTPTILWNQTASECRGWRIPDERTLEITGDYQPRLFFKYAANDEVVMIDMKKDVIEWTQDVSELGRRFNGALYTSWVSPANRQDAGLAAKYYCDANDGTGNNLWCPEMDLGEANRCGLRSTSHPVIDLNDRAWAGDAVNCFFPSAQAQPLANVSGAMTRDMFGDSTSLVFCGIGKGRAIDAASKTQSWVDHFGNGLVATSDNATQNTCSQLQGLASGNDAYQGVQLGAEAQAILQGSALGPTSVNCHYGPGTEYDINTNYPYSVKTTFAWNQTTHTLDSFTTTLTQEGRSITMTQHVDDNPAHVTPPNIWSNDGKMGLLAQLWTSDGMSWLSGSTCAEVHKKPESETTFRIQDIRINGRPLVLQKS